MAGQAGTAMSEQSTRMGQEYYLREHQKKKKHISP